MSTVPGWLWYDGMEIFNNARTLAYLKAHGDMGGRLTVEGNAAACPSAAVVPGISPWNGTDQSAWPVPFYTSIFLDQAPWFDANNPHSGDFLGYWVTDITGVDGKHHTRSTTPRGSRLGGVSFGQRKDAGREMTFTVRLNANTEQGMAYGMDWLEDRLLGPLCDVSCREAEMFIRTCCPPDDDFTYGFWSMKNVALTAGPEWGAPLMDDHCHLQEVQFTMVAGDPCRYGVPQAILAPTQIDTATTCNLIQRYCTADASTRVYGFVDPPQMGAKGLRIHVSAGDSGAPGVNIYTIPAPNAVTVDDCYGLQITREVQLRGIGPGDGLLMDTGRQTVDFLPEDDQAFAVTGFEYLGFQSGRVIDWPLIIVNRALVVVEAAGLGCGSGSFTLSLEAYEARGCAALYAESAISGFDYGLFQAP